MKINGSGFAMVFLLGMIVPFLDLPLSAQTTSPDRNAYEFRYVAEPEEPVAVRYRTIDMELPGGLSREQLIADVDLGAESEWRIGWFVYGEHSSRSVAVGLRGNSPEELFVDLDRNRRFSEEERVRRDPGNDSRWRTAIGAEFLTDDNQYEHFERSIFIRPLGTQGLEMATEGVMRGSVLVDGTWLRVVRVDRDANGRWFDSSDRIMVDMNGDGKADPIGERISCESICRMKGKRFVLQSNMSGEQLAFAELSGVGTVVPQLDLLSDLARIDQLSGTLVSRDGVRVALSSLNRPIECPVGDYRIESLTLEVSEANDRYWFQFSSFGTAKHPVIVKTGGSVTADLLGQLSLSSTLVTVSSGASVHLIITPLLETSQGLCMTGCRRGRGRATLENRLLAQSVFEERIIDNGSTGFS